MLCVRRGANQKFCKKRAGKSGTKIYRGPHFDEVAVSQCPYHDRGKHRKCAHLPHCGTIRQRSPNGINKRAKGWQPLPA